MVSELQDLSPPLGLTVDVTVEDGCFVLGDTPGSGISVDEAVIASADYAASGPPRGPQILAERAGRRLDSELPR
jgi:hypothetical protein